MPLPPIPAPNVEKMIRSDMARERRQRRLALRDRVAAELFVHVMKDATLKVDESMTARNVIRDATALADAAYPDPGD